MTADYIINQLGAVLEGHIAVENWRRVAVAVIADAPPQQQRGDVIHHP
jgi:hypothetical protein